MTHASNADLRIQILASGSKGNALVLDTGSVRLLVDAGLSCKELEKRLRYAALDPAKIDALLITHEHSDHIRGVSVFARRYGTPVYAAQRTGAALLAREARPYPITPFDPAQAFDLHGICVSPFRISHDTCDPVAFTFEIAGLKVGLATDLGIVTESVENALSGSDLLVLESNHDERMLWTGPYPWMLKKRVGSDLGHLSNRQTSKLVERLMHPGLRHLVLAHLSEKNNTPEAAAENMRLTLDQLGASTCLSIAKQHMPIPAITLEKR